MLPRKGTILDLGAGTMNFPLFALMKSPSRKVVAVDFAPQALLQGRKKLRLLLEGLPLDGHRWVEATLPNSRLRDVRADAVTLINVLYAMKDKQAMLLTAKANLKPGGTLILVDYTPRFRSAEKVKKFLLALASSAMLNHSPMTDFDLALISAIYLRKLTRGRGDEPGPEYLAPSALAELCQSLNFEVLESESVYAGSSRLFRLRNLG
jgi:ubiquinone/menaquinone biosynthesis C-methylase UbiE